MFYQTTQVFLAAEQAAQIINDKNVYIIQTRTQMQGISAMLFFNGESSAEENLDLLNDAIKNVTTGVVTTAVRNTKIDNVKINEEFIGIINRKDYNLYTKLHWNR